MRKTLLLLSVLFLPAFIFAQTEVSGNQSGTWNYSASPYSVVGDINVPAGDTLFIEPGVFVNFSGYFKITIHGTLIAVGTETDSIYFSPEDISTGWHGLRFNSTQTVSRLDYCSIKYGKTSGGVYPSQHGGGIMLENSDIILEHSFFANNEANGDDNGMGGAIYGINTTSQSHITNCKFINNHSYGEGGAIKLSGDNGMKIERCTFINNSVLYGGGAICLYGCFNTELYRSLFVGNVTTYSSGGSVLIEGYSTRVKFINCTMINNSAPGGDGGAVEIAFSEASFTNSIIYNNNGAYSDNIFLDFGGTAEINYCNTPFPDDATGENNINVNAQFVDAENNDFHLTRSSPCIDTGIDSLTIHDASGTTIAVIILDSSEYVGNAPDMGCYEFGMPNKVNDNTDGIVNRFELYQNYPNPFNPTTTIEYSIPTVTNGELTNVNISVFDILGRKVATLVNGLNSAGKHRIQFDASHLSSGIYFYLLKSGDFSVSKKMILMK